MPKRMKGKTSLLVGLLLISMVSPAQPEEIQELAKQVQNPVSDLIRFGFTNNILLGAGSNNHEINVLNLTGDTTKKFGRWSFLNRLVIPLIYLPASAPDGPSGDSGRSVGLGDIDFTTFLARDESKRFLKSIGGVGPTFLFNSATDDRMGTGKWSVGPTLAIVKMPDPWVYGVLVRNLWSFAGDPQRKKVNLFVLRPFVNFNFSNGWYLTTSPVITANWEADSHNRWTVPVGGGIGKVMFRNEKRPINLRAKGFYFLEKPNFTPDWTLQIEFQILFPQ